MTAIDRYSGLAPNLGRKAPVRVATTANITLSGLQTIDGVTVTSGDRVLVCAQTSASQNGIYNAASGNWTRSVDFNSLRDFAKGTGVFVAEGATYAGRELTVATYPAVFDLNSITFTAAVTPVFAESRFLRVSTNTYTLRADNNDKLIHFDYNGAVTITVPAGLGTYWSTRLRKDGNGYLTFTVSAVTWKAPGDSVVTGGANMGVTLYSADVANTIHAEGAFA